MAPTAWETPRWRGFHMAYHALIAGTRHMHKVETAREEAAMSEGKWTATNGQDITEEMIGRWCDAYERGEFPEGERNVGKVIYGCISLSSDGTATISIEVPAGLKRAIGQKARDAGMGLDEFVLAALTDKLLDAS